MIYADTIMVAIPRDYVEHDCGEEEVNSRGRDATLPVRMRQLGGLTRGKTLRRRGTFA